ncbi:MAG: hypothetical protein HUU60_03145 [Armatimonadetes bacterium]|nr:hypothetical protein [Armatimonadota bacterium]
MTGSMAMATALPLASTAITLGIEEEVFITQPTRPTLNSLYYLSKLLAKDPKRYYFRSASNFSRGKDAKECLMSGVEISTDAHASIDEVLSDLSARRRDLAWAVDDAYIVPVGMLFDIAGSTNTSGLHIHIGAPVRERQRIYQNIARFMPLLILACASSPFLNGRPVGPSARAACSFAIGALRDDPLYRFQDLIVSRRLGTVELRALDPVWDLARLREVLRIVQAIALWPETMPLDLEQYAALREDACTIGLTPRLRSVLDELRRITPAPDWLFERTIADELTEFHAQQGLEKTYSALDRAYRTGVFEPGAPLKSHGSAVKGAAGLVGYYLVRLPFTVYKAWREWR